MGDALTELVEVTVYFWPYENYDFIQHAIPPEAELTITAGSLARGDLELEPYVLNGRFSWQQPTVAGAMADFGGISLLDAELLAQDDDELLLELAWAGAGDGTVFVHILHNDDRIGQSDAPIGSGYWPTDWIRADLIIREQHHIPLSQPYNPQTDTILIGLYNPATGERLGEPYQIEAVD